MALPASVTLVTVHVRVLHCDLTGTPATGFVTFAMPHTLRDSAGAVILGRRVFVATLDVTGSATVQMPATDDPDLSPSGWTYTVTPVTDAWHDPPFALVVPVATVGVLELAQHAPAVTPDATATYALLGHVHTIGQITGLATELDDLHERVTDLEASPGGGGGGGALPRLFDVENPAYAGGAVGDGVTDDYPAIRAAWDALLASATGGVLLFPRVATYRVVATAPRLTPTSDGARALFPLPMRSRQLPKLAYGIRGVGEAFVVRTADLGSTPGQVQTASVLHVDYDVPFAWSSAGLPCVIGTPDVDATGAGESNIFSNLHVSIDDLIIRQPDNPSLCAVNLEQASTVRIGALRVDVEPVLDLASEPTHPTGGALLLPRSNNNVAVLVDRLVVEGCYAGAPLTEHGHLRDVIVLRCKVGVHTRRPNSHHGEADSLKIEQCPNWISGWDPSGAGPDGGVVPIHGWSGYIRKMAGEDYAYNGTQPWLFAPTAGAHINDPGGVLSGTIAYGTRIMSEPASPPGIGIGPGGSSSSFYVRGPGGTTASPIALYGINHAAGATRLLPPGDEPVTEFQLFPATDGPDTSATDSQPINLAVKVNLTAPVNATEIRFHRGTTAIDGAITGRIWRLTGVGAPAAVAGTDVTFALSGTGWQTAEFADPVALDPAETYAVTVHFPARFPFTASYWDSGPGGSGIVNGPLKAFSTNDIVGGQGGFSSGAITTAPTGNGNGSNYWIDVTVVEA